MSSALRAWFDGLRPRERRMLVAGACVLALLLLFGAVLLPLNAALVRARRSDVQRREDLQWMRVNAPEIRAGAGRLRVPSAEPPIVLVDRTAHDSGLSSALRGTQPSGSGGLQVQLQDAPFDALVIWLGALDQRYGLAVQSITVDRGTRAGTVDANVTFAAPAR